MPINPRIAEIDADIATARTAGLQGQVPPAREPLKAAVVNALGAALQEAIPILTGGQVPPEAIQIERVTGTVEQVPPEIGAQVATLARFVSEMGDQIPALANYQFDPIEAVASNAGLDDLQVMLDGMARDKELLGQLSQPPPPQVDPNEGMEGEPPEDVEEPE